MTAIKVELQLADGSFTSGMLRAGQTMAGFERQLVRANPRLATFAQNGQSVIRTMNQMDDSSKSFMSTMRDLSIVTGLVSMGLSAASRVANGWVGEIVKVNAEMERMRFQMQAMSTASDPIKDAADNVKYLREQATQMPFSLNAIQGAFTKLKATGVDPTAGSLKAIADGIAAFGGSDEQLQRVTVALTQMSGKSVIQMEELRQQLGEHMPSAMQVMARAMGVSVADLTKSIATGTVSARGNLERFYAELERSYGGSAQKMMQTFSGQIALLKTSMQNLASADAGNAFFEKVKDQLRDINAFLQGDLAKNIANSIGSALGSAVGYLRTAVEAVWNFRSQLVDLAMIAGSGLGLVVAVKGLQSMTTAVLAATASWQGLAVGLRSGFRDIALGMSGLRSLSTATTGVGVAAIGARTALSSIALGLSGMAPVLTIVVGALYLVAEGFGLLSDKTKTAYDELVKYGAESRKQARETIQNREQVLRERIRLEEEMARYADANAGTMEGVSANYDPSRLSAYKAELEELQKRKDDILRASGEREDNVANQAAQRRLQDQIDLARADYRKLSNERQILHNQEMAQAAKNNTSKKAVDDKYRADQLKLQLDFYGKQRSLIKAEEDQILADMEKADADRKIQLAKRLKDVTDQLQAADNQLARAQTSKGGFGVDTLDAPESEEKKIKRGTTTLAGLREEVAGLEAALNGGNTALGELQFKLQRGDYGSMSEATEETRKLHEGLLAATAAKEALDKIMKGRKKLDGDVERNRLAILEKQMELEERRAGRPLTEAEKIKLRLENGYYDGLGSSEKIKKDLDGLTASINIQGTSLDNVGNIAKQQAFGEATVTRIKTVTDAIQQLGQSILNVGGNLKNLDFSGFSASFAGVLSGAIDPVMQNLPKEVTSRMQMAMDQLTKKGWSREAAAGIVGNLVTESKLNPTARNKGDGKDGSDSVGVAQWNSGRALNLQKFAAERGKHWSDFETQIDFIDWELRNSHKGVGSRLQMAKDAKTAGDIAMREYEVPAKSAIAQTGGERIGNAIQAYGLPANTSPFIKPDNGNFLPLPPLSEVKERVTLQEQQAQKVGETNAKLNEQAKTEKELNQESKSLDRVDAEKKLQAEIDATAKLRKREGKSTPTEGSNYEKTVENIRLKKYGENTDETSAEYKKLIDLAKELDGIEKNIGETKKLTSQTDREKKRLEEERLELNRRIAEQQKKAADPNYKPDSQAVQALRTDLDAYLAKLKDLYGEDSTAYKQALDYKSSMLRQQQTLDLTTQMAKFAEERVANENSLLTQTEIRRREAEKQIAIIDGVIEKARENGTLEVGMVEQAEKAKAAIRAKYAQDSSPLTKQMKEWGDITTNLQKQTTSWMDSMADGLTGVIMGTTDLKTAAKQLISGILKDLINSGLKKLMSDMMGGAKSAGSGGKKGVGAAAARGGKKAVGAAHTGGVIGSSSLMTRHASPLSFIGAPKFHTGGIIGGLLPSEVPIIAKKGEGVFTPEQMEQMGGMQQTNFQISAPVTVNGSSGTPEQNQDLAKRMAREMELTMRSVVADEFRKQSRPGNFANNRNR